MLGLVGMDVVGHLFVGVHLVGCSGWLITCLEGNVFMLALFCDILEMGICCC